MAHSAIHIDLSDEASVEFVKRKLATGDYASEEEVVRECILVSRQQESSLENWLATEGVARYDRFHADPSRALSLDELQTRLAAAREQRSSTGS